ncbi:hypothetical protein, partial [Cetobacterium sp.]|uniref:hypothetical protein n=1 Tax=Cetobacterium sp. TaxID=2071632 RepID=UPI003AF1BE2F
LKVKEIKDFSKDENSYIIKHDGNKYIYCGGSKDTYIDLTKLEKSINNQPEVDTENILNSIYKDGQSLSKLEITQTEASKISSIGQLYDGEVGGQKYHSLINKEDIFISNGNKISLLKDDLTTSTQAIGQAVNFGGAEVYNFGSIKVASASDIAVGQYVTGNNNLAIGRLGAYNFGLIGVSSSGQKSIIPGEKINSAGIYVNSIKTPVIGANFGTIKINNTDNTNGYYGVGMLADGKGAKVFNFGTIEVTEAATNNNNITPENQKFMVAKNGGRVYNYGTLKSNGKDIVVDGKVSSSTTAKYITDNKVIFTDEVEILSEVGKGDSYTIDSYITAKNGVEGLDQIKSTGVYETKAIEKIDKDGNTVVDLKLEKTKKIEDLTTGDLNRMIKEANLDSYVYADGKGKNAEAINYLVSTGNTENLKGIFAPVYENLNGSILKSAERFNDYAVSINSNEITEISGDFNRNFRGFFANDTLPNVKFGVFKNSRKDANLGAGIDYNRDSTTVIGSQYLTSNFVLNYGYENNKNEY